MNVTELHWTQDGATEVAADGYTLALQRISVELTGSPIAGASADEVQQVAELITAAPALAKLLARLEPHLGAIINYASTAGEYEPNAIAADVHGWLGHLRDVGALPKQEQAA